MSALNQALSDPATMQQVNSLISSLSQPDGNEQPVTGTPVQASAADSLNGIQALLGGQNSTDPHSDDRILSAAPAMPPEMDKIVKLMGILQQNNSDNGSIGLILALKPLLKPETQPKADRVIKLLRLMNAYPLIRDSGLLSDIF